MERIFNIDRRASSAQIRKISAETDSEFTVLFTRPTRMKWVNRGLERMVQVAGYTGADLVYADHFNGEAPAPVIDCTEGGMLRDDFDFGGVLLYRTSALRDAVSRMDRDFEYAGLYDLRLKVAQKGSVVHIPEYLYYEIEEDKRVSGQKIFDYLSSSNRAYQIEAEIACTDYLKAIGAWLPPVFEPVDLSEGDFENEASVVIPCRNRVRTIGDAIRSALSQKTDFPYNVIVVDDNSTDGTADVIKSFLDDPRLVYIPQDKSWHAIGDNWNAAVHHPKCGRFALQLDSDDVYPGPDTVSRFVDAFRSQNCAMVIGTYRVTDINLNEMAPGVIAHREWTEENGHNNALRVNGLGAPRGFWTPLLRRIDFPVVKYGEDYSVALRICRDWRIGRIYDVIYDCRRWDDNSDAALDPEAVNRNNRYKDALRTWELEARKRKMCEK